jgi:sugar phosphate isomerase/epimerase
MRLGGPIFGGWNSPEEWIGLLKAEGYRSAFSPIGPEASDAEVREYRAAAARADILISEVGIWNNVLSPDPAERKRNIEHAKSCLDLAERIGANCTVNLAGTRGLKWDGPHDQDYSGETFGMAVETAREIIDAVKPRRTFYTIETMPWMIPDSAECYRDLIGAVDRPAFACHFDPVNLINSPRLYRENAGMTAEFVKLLGPWIKSCHIKDIVLRDHLTVHLDEVVCGEGGFDHAACLRVLDALDPDLPILLEHLPTPEDYRKAAGHIRKVAGINRLKV